MDAVASTSGRPAIAVPPPDTFSSATARRWFLGVLFLVSMLNYTDRVIFFMMVDDIKADLGLSDFEIGLAGGISFALFQTLLGLPLARLAERRSRTTIIAVCTGFWSLMTAACGLATNFVQLMIGRMGVGIGEAAFLPAASSLLGDAFRADRRGGAMSILQLGSPVSAIFAALLTVFVAGTFGWRVAFFVAGLPGLLVMILVWRLREPERGKADGVVEEAVPSLLDVLLALLRRRSFLFVALAALLVTMGMHGISNFLAAYYGRTFGLSTGQAAMMYGFINAFALGCSMMIAGFGMDWAGRLDRRWHAWIPAAGVLLSAIFYAIAFSRDSMVSTGFFVMLGGLTQFFFYVPTLTMVQNMVGPRMRASAIAIISVITGLIGGGAGPALTGVLSDRFAIAAFDHGGGAFHAVCPNGVAAEGSAPALVEACTSAAASGLQGAFLVLCGLFALSAVFYFLAAGFVERDAFRPERRAEA